MRVFFSNLGCKLNQAELEELARKFAAAGHSVVSSLDEADLHVVNSCTVTHRAARDSRKLARSAARRRPELRTVLTGCYAEASPDEAGNLDGVDLVVANADKDRLVERVHESLPGAKPRTPEVPVPYVPLEFGNTRALVKIEDGCNMRCSFCIIPSTRGRQRSRSPEHVLQDVAGLTGAGFPEIVLTGVQISAYRHGSARLADLVETVLEKTPARRLRLTSIAPWDFDERLLNLFPTGRLCRHFHLSLQSGSARTLRRMRRPYSPEKYAALVDRIRAAVPGVAITTDVIAGFPGETEEESRESLDFIRRIGFARVHAFPFSPRPGTEAAGMDGAVSPAVARQRMKELLEVATESERRFAEAQAGTDAEVLWERRRDGLWEGTTDNYLRAVARSGENLQRRLTPARIGPVENTGAPADRLRVRATPLLPSS